MWDYPRPPRLDPDDREVTVGLGEFEIARSRAAIRVLETASPPTFYIPRQDVRADLVLSDAAGSICEWKGQATYWSIRLTPERLLPDAAWSYEHPFDEFDAIAGYVSFYPARVQCTVGGVRVDPQPGGFYGGWVTPEVIGPFKGESGTGHW